MVGPSSRNTDAGWCSVFHQSTENLMIGMLMKPTSVMIAAARADLRRVVERPRQRDDAEIHQEQHEDRGQPRVPHPPGAPHRLAPDRAGDQRQRREDRADRRRRLQRHVGQRMPPDQRAERGERHQRVAHHGEPGERHVDVHDPHRDALLEILRRGEAEIEADGEHERGSRRQPWQQAVGQGQELRRIGEIGEAPRRAAAAGVAHATLHRPAAGCAAIATERAARSAQASEPTPPRLRRRCG